MLYHFFNYINQNFDFPGSGLFQFISFRSGMAVITSLVITLVFGGRLIKFLQRKQVGESIRDLGLEGQMVKAGTPTMGGVIILALRSSLKEDMEYHDPQADRQLTAIKDQLKKILQLSKEKNQLSTISSNELAEEGFLL